MQQDSLKTGVGAGGGHANDSIEAVRQRRPSAMEQRMSRTHEGRPYNKSLHHCSGRSNSGKFDCVVRHMPLSSFLVITDENARAVFGRGRV